MEQRPTAVWVENLDEIGWTYKVARHKLAPWVNPAGTVAASQREPAGILRQRLLH